MLPVGLRCDLRDLRRTGCEKASVLLEVTDPVLAANVAEAVSVRGALAARNSRRPARVGASVRVATPGTLKRWLVEATSTGCAFVPAVQVTLT